MCVCGGGSVCKYFFIEIQRLTKQAQPWPWVTWSCGELLLCDSDTWDASGQDYDGCYEIRPCPDRAFQFQDN